MRYSIQFECYLSTACYDGASRTIPPNRRAKYTASADPNIRRGDRWIRLLRLVLGEQPATMAQYSILCDQNKRSIIRCGIRKGRCRVLWDAEGKIQAIIIAVVLISARLSAFCLHAIAKILTTLSFRFIAPRSLLPRYTWTTRPLLITC